MTSEQEILSAAAQCLNGMDVSKARQILLVGLEHYPNSILVLQALGDIAMELGESEEAHRLFLRLVSVAPRHSYALVHLALISLKLGKGEDYKNALAAALRVDPQAAEILESYIKGGDCQASFGKGNSLARIVPCLPADQTPPRVRVPVVLLQVGDQPYLKPVVRQAKEHNSEIVLIAEGAIDSMRKEVDFVEMKGLHDEATYFSKLYRHLSTNPYITELFCFTRWFLLKRFMETRGLSVCMHIDSDVLLYVNAQRDLMENYGDGYQWTLINGTVGSTAFVTLEGVRQFCDFVRSVYENKAGNHFQTLLELHRQMVAANSSGGVSDMALLDLYRRECGAKIGEMTEVRDGGTYDHNLNRSDGYEMHNGFKKIYPHEGNPYCKRETDGKFIRFKCLHFQGHAKSVLNQLADAIRQSRKATS